MFENRKVKEKIAACPVDDSFCIFDIEDQISFEMPVNNNISFDDTYSSLTVSDLKNVLMVDQAFEPLDLDGIPEEKLIRFIYNKSVSDLYYFCWRYSWKVDNIIPYIKLSNYKKPGLLHHSTEFLSNIKIGKIVYDLIKPPDLFKGGKGAKHDDMVFPYRYGKTKKGQEIYNKLKNWDFIDKLGEFTRAKLSYFASEQKFEICFKQHFFFDKIPEDNRKKIALTELNKEFNIKLPKKGFFVEFNRSYFKIVDYEFIELKTKDLKFSHIEIIIYCDQCAGITKWNLEKLDLNKLFNSVVVTKFCRYCKDPVRLFIMQDNFSKFSYKDKSIRKAKTLQQNNIQVRITAEQRERIPELRKISDKDILTCLKVYLNSKWVSTSQIANCVLSKIPNGKEYAKEIRSLKNPRNKKSAKNNFKNQVIQKLIKIKRLELINYRNQLFKISKKGKKIFSVFK